MYKKSDRGGRASYGRNLIKSHLPRLLSAYCFQLCFSWRIPIYFYNSKMSFFSSELSSHINYHVFAPSLWLFLWNCRNDSSVIMPQIANIYLLNGITHEPFFDDNWVVTLWHGFKFILQQFKIYSSVTERSNK